MSKHPWNSTKTASEASVKKICTITYKSVPSLFRLKLAGCRQKHAGANICDRAMFVSAAEKSGDKLGALHWNANIFTCQNHVESPPSRRAGVQVEGNTNWSAVEISKEWLECWGKKKQGRDGNEVVIGIHQLYKIGKMLDSNRYTIKPD